MAGIDAPGYGRAKDAPLDLIFEALHGGRGRRLFSQQARQRPAQPLDPDEPVAVAGLLFLVDSRQRGRRRLGGGAALFDFGPGSRVVLFGDQAACAEPRDPLRLLFGECERRSRFAEERALFLARPRRAAAFVLDAALFGGNLTPRYAWAHDVNGAGPTFNEGQKAQSLGLSWEYQRKWLVDAQYTMYSGGRTYCGTDANPPTSPIPPGQSANWCGSAFALKDRDFWSVSVSYSF